jgi:hypothetical protein
MFIALCIIRKNKTFQAVTGYKDLVPFIEETRDETSRSAANHKNCRPDPNRSKPSIPHRLRSRSLI